MLGSRQVELDRARRLFEKGSLTEAAVLLHELRRRAADRYDGDLARDVDDYAEQMRRHLDGATLATFEEALRDGGPQSGATEKTSADEFAATPVSLAIAGLGALLMLISVFLPRVDSATFARVAQNTLIQSGDGWVFIALAIGVAGATYRAYYKHSRTIAPAVLGAIAIANAIYDGVNKDSLRLCSTDPTGFNSGCEIAHPSIGIYAAGVGGALAVVAGLQIWRAERVPRSADGAVATSTNETKRCPDCAETVLAAAKVCKHCGFRFDRTAGPGPA